MFWFGCEDYHTVVGEGSVSPTLARPLHTMADLSFGLQKLWTDSSQHVHL